MPGPDPTFWLARSGCSVRDVLGTVLLLDGALFLLHKTPARNLTQQSSRIVYTSISYYYYYIVERIHGQRTRRRPPSFWPDLVLSQLRPFDHLPSARQKQESSRSGIHQLSTPPATPPRSAHQTANQTRQLRLCLASYWAPGLREREKRTARFRPDAPSWTNREMCSAESALSLPTSHVNVICRGELCPLLLAGWHPLLKIYIYR